MKALNQNFFEQYSNGLFNTLTHDEELTINLSAEDTLFARYSRARVRQVTEVEQAYASMNLIKGNKSISINVLYTGIVENDIKTSYEKIKEARYFLEVMPEDPYLVRPQNLGSSTTEAIHGVLSGEEMMSQVSKAAGEVDLAGLLTSGEVVRASMNSKGQKHWFKTQSYSLDYSLYNPRQKAVKSMYAGTRFDNDELKKNLDESHRKLNLLNKEVKKVARGEYKIYLAPGAVAELLGTLSWGGVSMSAHQRGQGSLKQLWKGEKKLSPKFNLSENFELNLSPRFNSTGEVAPMNLSIIENGEYRNFLTSTRSANEFKLESNFATEWESLRSPVIRAGEISEEEILSNLGNGLYISDLHYLNWSDRETARITGMTRYACFWVEDGELVSPIEDLRFDESYYHIFGEGLLGLTNKSYVIPSTGSYFEREVGGMLVPGIIVDNFKFTL
jgi:predicted Zn-dependent protease